MHLGSASHVGDYTAGYVDAATLAHAHKVDILGMSVEKQVTHIAAHGITFVAEFIGCVSYHGKCFAVNAFEYVVLHCVE